jgi:methionyl-tRNA formyltransferase
MSKLDLFVGGDIGAWVLSQVYSNDIEQVFAANDTLSENARRLGMRATSENINACDFAPAQIGFSVHYPHIIKPHIIARYKKIYNIHPGYLPWGRGFYPMFWAIWENTPAGCTLHEITAGIDEGPIVAQTNVPLTEVETGGSLYKRVREAEFALIQTHLPLMLTDTMPTAHPQSQSGVAGTYHTKREFLSLRDHPPIASMNASALIRLARALTFEGYPSLRVAQGKNMIELKVNIVSK